jgi:hypothetical protein
VAAGVADLENSGAEPEIEMDPSSNRSPTQPDPPTSTQEERMARMENSLSAIIAQLGSLAPRSQEPENRRARSPDRESLVLSRPVPSTNSPEIRVRNRRYAQVLAVESYRLRDRTPALLPDDVENLTKASNQIRPRLEGCFFTGDPPLSILPFLCQLVRVADQSHMSEATLLWVAEDFLKSPVKEAFRAQNSNTWPEAVHWLIVTYAAESLLDAAVRRLQTTSQGAHESVRQFGLRLQLEAAALGSLLDAMEVKSLFAQGLRDPIRSLFAANQPVIELEDTTPLSVLVSRATLLESGTQSTTRVEPRPYGSRSPILATPVLSGAEDDEAQSAHVLALAARNGRSPTDRWTCYVCFRQGHGWIDCEWLRHVPAEEKEEALLRRRAHFDRARSPSPTPRPATSFPSASTSGREGQGAWTSPKTSLENVRAPPRQ